MPPSPWIVIAGPTGTGKSELAVSVAERVRGEVVNGDSVQVYRGFDIGSAKPSPALRTRVPHHLFDIATADEGFDAAAFSSRAREACGAIEARGAIPVIAGGTGFYLRALLAGLPELPPRDPALRSRLRALLDQERGRARLHRWLQRVDPVSAGRIALADRHRLERALEVWILTGRPISASEPPSGESVHHPRCLLVLDLPREQLAERLDLRVERMYAEGLIEETARLLEAHRSDVHPFGSIGYAEAVRVVLEEWPLEEAVRETKRRTRAYAKRQRTWFRAEQDVQWLDASKPLEELTEESVTAWLRTARGGETPK